MNRWILALLGLALAIAALVALARRVPGPADEEIDAASREKLERLLRESAE